VLATLALGALLCGAPAFALDLFGVRGPWIDDRGRPFALESLRGTHTVISMAYGACRRVCSTSLRLLEQLQARAESRGVVLNFVVIGLDPTQDRPADWAAYRTERSLTRSNWHFLVGDAAATRRMASWLGVRYWHYGEHVMHDFRIVLVSPQGRVATSMTVVDQNLDDLIP
jgi:cytochrome oxidase Cu insertion factor (SCO1/SenC/PrrC family)